jgi:hypothetical protein
MTEPTPLSPAPADAALPGDEVVPDQVIALRFTEPVEGADPDDGETFVASRHRVRGAWLRQDVDHTIVVDVAGEVVGRWPTRLIEQVAWSATGGGFGVAGAGGRGPSRFGERMRTLREQYPKAWQKWEADEDEQLADEFDAGLTVAVMAELHQRAPGGILARLVGLGLVDRRTPEDAIGQPPATADTAAA